MHPEAPLPAPDGAPAPRPPVAVKSVTTRFLYPFYFQRDVVPEAVARLTTGTNGARAQWAAAAPHEQYTDEFLEHVVTYLFPGGGGAGTDRRHECAYLRADAAPDWFRDLRLEHPSDSDGPSDRPARRTLGVAPPTGVQIEAPTGAQLIPPAPMVELFLSSQGVGVLSVTLTAVADDLTIGDAIHFNYRLAQYRHEQSGRLVRGAPTKGTENRPVAEQLAAPDCSFLLQNVMSWLTEPLADFNRRPVQPRELCVYTVVRVGEADFSDPAVRKQFAPALSALAQVEPDGTAGPGDGEISVPAALLNRRHWSAIGVLGAAHLVSDRQETDGRRFEYNYLRPQLALNKYFVSYLLALIQQHTMHRAVDEAVKVLTLPADDERLKKTRSLRRDLLRFGVGGLFNQISSRHNHHRFYRLAREALDVRRGWEDVTRAVADLDADLAAQQREETEKAQNRLADEMRRSVFEIASVQRVVHFIEYLLAAVYLGHFWHMLAHHNHWLAHLAADHLGWTNWDAVVTAGMFFWATVGVLFVMWLNNRRAKHPREETPP